MIWFAALVSAGGAAARTGKLNRQAKDRVFTVRMLAALEMKFRKSAKPPRRSLRRQRLHLVENAHGLQDHTATDFQAFDAELVHRVLDRMMKDVVVSVVDVDDVGTRHADAHEWQM